jgi:hypothetical protein
MRYGFYIPTRGPTATRGGILALAREGERLGLHSAMIADHIVFPVESQSIYPYTLDGRHPGSGDALETFSILGVLAGATERLRLVTSVLVLPYRNPVLTAKMVASLDVLSGGRLTLGVGTGWLQEEFAALNSPAFDARGAVTNEWKLCASSSAKWVAHVCDDVSRFGGTAFLRPGLGSIGHRAQRRSRMAAGHRQSRRTASLTAVSTVARSARPASSPSCRLPQHLLLVLLQMLHVEVTDRL